MLSRVCLLFAGILLPVSGFAVTLEVINLYQPLSLHGTDGVGEDHLEGEDPFQAAVMPRPFAVTGAIPEDLVKAVATPHAIPSNGLAYAVKDANLLSLCKIALKVEMSGGKLLVRLDVAELEIPEEVDLTSRQILRLAIKAIRMTLLDYFEHGAEDEAPDVSVGIIGTDEGTESLKDLAVRFKAGVK